MDKLEKLNANQELLMHSTKEEYINDFFNLKEINKKDFEEGINWLYTDLLKKSKPKVIYCDSWLSALITIFILKKGVSDSIRASVWASIRASVSDSIRASVSDSVSDSIRASVSDSIRASVSDSIWASVSDSVSASVSDSVSDSVWASVSDSIRASVWASVWAEFNNYSNYSNTGSNFGWVAFYDYFEKIGVLKNDNFRKYKKLVKSGAFQVYEYEKFVFAIQPPIKISRNENGQLNDLNEKAFKWNDGYGFYYINGFSIKEDLFNQLKNKTVTLEQFLKEDNEEVKSAIIGYIQQSEGDEGVYRFFQKHLKEVDSFVDKKENHYLEGTTKGMNVGVYTLFKGSINGTNIAYIRCYCPSTDRMFFLGVEPSNNNSKDAIASLYQVPEILKNNIISISRQGEKFSTVFDDATTEKLQRNEYSENELKQYVSVTGDEYFKLMTYEF